MPPIEPASVSAGPRGRGSLERLRTANRRAITTLLTAEGPLSRADLARASGLSRTTASSLVGELSLSGRVVKPRDGGGPHKGGRGRPPPLPAMSTPLGLAAGMHMGHRHVRVVIADRAGTVIAEAQDVTDA